MLSAALAFVLAGAAAAQTRPLPRLPAPAAPSLPAFAAASLPSFEPGLGRDALSPRIDDLARALGEGGLLAPSPAAPAAEQRAAALGALRAVALRAAAEPAALAEPARALLRALTSPAAEAELAARLDAPARERMAALAAGTRERPESARALTEVLARAEAAGEFDRGLLDALFDGSGATGRPSAPVAGSESSARRALARRRADGAGAPRAEPPPPADDARVLRRAGLEVAAWAAAAAAFGAGLWHWAGTQAFNEYLTTYAIEWSMSLDNLIVISTSLLAVPESLRPRVVRWGLIGTVAARLIMVAGGVGLVGAVHGAFYAFGAFLIATALKMVSPKLDAFAALGRLIDRAAPGLRARVADAARRALPPFLRGPVALGVLAVVGYGIVFALDSVPAALAVSRRPMVIFAANAFSVMGLGALLSIVQWLEKKFSRLGVGVAGVLLFVGAKMIVEPLFGVAAGSAASLAVIALLLGGSALWSVLSPRDDSR